MVIAYIPTSVAQIPGMRRSRIMWQHSSPGKSQNKEKMNELLWGTGELSGFLAVAEDSLLSSSEWEAKQIRQVHVASWDHPTLQALIKQEEGWRAVVHQVTKELDTTEWRAYPHTQNHFHVLGFQGVSGISHDWTHGHGCLLSPHEIRASVGEGTRWWVLGTWLQSPRQSGRQTDSSGCFSLTFSKMTCWIMFSTWEIGFSNQVI